MAAGTTPTQMPTFHTCSEPLLTTANSTSVQCNADTGMFGQEDYLGKTEFCYAMCGPITKPLADTDTYPPPAIRNARSEVCNFYGCGVVRPRRVVMHGGGLRLTLRTRESENLDRAQGPTVQGSGLSSCIK